MSNPILATTNSKLDTRVKEPSGVVPPSSGVGSSGPKPDRFKLKKKRFCHLFKLKLLIIKFSLTNSVLYKFYLTNYE